MGIPNLIRPGDRLPAYPAGTHNWLVQRVRELVANKRPETFLAPETFLPRAASIRCANKSGEDIGTMFGVLELETPLNNPGEVEGAEAASMVINGVKPGPDGKPFAVLQYSAIDGGVVAAVVTGLTWAKVEVLDISATTCGPVENDTAKLSTESRGANIIWKEDGAGEKWAIVSLGGSSTATADLSGNLALAVQNIPRASFDAAGNDEWNWKVTSGISGELQGNVILRSSGVLLIDWKRDAPNKEAYIDPETGDLAPYVVPWAERTAVYELDPTFIPPEPQTEPPTYADVVPAWRAAENLTATDIRASNDAPIVCLGFVQEVTQTDELGEEITQEIFVIENAFEIRQMPNWALGSAPSAGDDPGMQVVRHIGGEEAGEVSTTLDCEAP